ncbi:hypothetical protein Taro_017499 [Colocasia esculenta]|uniref:Uncharacterized protein n=1 Tax=Colocasia esculenta TaxID=4460 RepID=A0A843UNA3_COLES|nr:hypothetical protein [Colocasia esculenta]
MAIIIARQPLRPPWGSSLAGSGQLRRLNRPPHLLPILPAAAGGQRPYSGHLRTEAPQVTAAALYLDASAPAGDPSVLIPISTLLLLVYWMANFVVPGMISKDLQAGESSEESGPGDERRGE